MQKLIRPLLEERPGSLLVDVLLSVGVFGVIIAALSQGIGAGVQGSAGGGQAVRATYLVEEGIEVVRSIRDKTGVGEGFTSIRNSCTGQTCYIDKSGNDWTIGTSAPTTITNPIDGIYTRAILVTDDGNGSDTRKVTVNVTWDSGTKSRSLETYITDWTSDPPPDWSDPVKIANITFATDNFEKIAIQGTEAYIVGNNIDADGFYKYDISDIDNGNITLLGSSNINSASARAKNLVISGNYAYVATTDSAGTKIKIIDITYTDTPTPYSIPCCAGTISLGTSNPRGLAIANNKLFITMESSGGEAEFLRYDLSNPVLPTADGSYNFTGGDGNIDMRDIVINGNYAYVAGDEPTEISAFDITASPNPTYLGGRDVTLQHAFAKTYAVEYVDGVFLGAQQWMGNNDLFSFDTLSDPEMDDPPGSPVQDGNLDIAGGISENIFDIDAGTEQQVGFMATDRRINDANPPCFTKHFLVIVDFSDLANIDLPAATLFNGSKFDADFSCQVDAQGIAFRESDNTVFLVTGHPETYPSTSKAGDFVVIRPN